MTEMEENKESFLKRLLKFKDKNRSEKQIEEDSEIVKKEWWRDALKNYFK